MYTAIAGFLAPYAKKIAVGILVTVVLIGGYYSWKHHIEAVQHEKDMAEVERKTKELLQRKMVEVKIENDALQVRKDRRVLDISIQTNRNVIHLYRTTTIQTGCSRKLR